MSSEMSEGLFYMGVLPTPWSVTTHGPERVSQAFQQRSKQVKSCESQPFSDSAPCAQTFPEQIPSLPHAHPTSLWRIYLWQVQALEKA